jgi:hypothetical protein
MGQDSGPMMCGTLSCFAPKETLLLETVFHPSVVPWANDRPRAFIRPIDRHLWRFDEVSDTTVSLQPIKVVCDPLRTFLGNCENGDLWIDPQRCGNNAAINDEQSFDVMRLAV